MTGQKSEKTKPKLTGQIKSEKTKKNIQIPQ